MKVKQRVVNVLLMYIFDNTLEKGLRLRKRKGLYEC